MKLFVLSQNFIDKNSALALSNNIPPTIQRQTSLGFKKKTFHPPAQIIEQKLINNPNVNFANLFYSSYSSQHVLNFPLSVTVLDVYAVCLSFFLCLHIYFSAFKGRLLVSSINKIFPSSSF